MITEDSKDDIASVLTMLFKADYSQLMIIDEVAKILTQPVEEMGVVVDFVTKRQLIN